MTTLTQVPTPAAADTPMARDSDRWRPERAGLIALWRYWDETFSFHRGRLLLRGPNGSGKSLALELLLPFLLDADASPHRLTSATKSRGGLFDRMMAGTADTTRTGFAWVEFTRGEQVFTVGVRLRTSTQTRKVDAQYFTTSQRIGAELHLLDPDRNPLSRRELEAAIGELGRVYRSGDEYRGAVRATLFPGFSAERYASVITAMLALRKEKLSQNLDLAKLSEVLSEALNPIDEHDLAAVAEGFERLDRRRAELARLESEVGEVRQLEQSQHQYARAVLWLSAGRVRSTENDRDNVTRDEREASTQLAAARVKAEQADTQRDQARERLARIRTEREALRDRDEYTQGTGLNDLHTRVHQLGETLNRADQAAARARKQLSKDQAAADTVGDRANEASNNHQHALGELRATATTAGAESVLAGTPTEGVGDIERLERLIEAWLRARREAITEVRAALNSHGETLRNREHAEQQQSRDLGIAETRATAEAEARHEVDAAITRYRDQVAAWCSDASAIGADRIRSLLPARVEDPQSVQAAITELRTTLSGEHQVARAGVAARRRELTGTRQEVEAERQRIATGEQVTPVPPGWRDDRSGRPGGPLWRLVEIAQGADPDLVDGIESALAAAGLLDAWVAPDATINVQAHDLTLTTEPAQGLSLTELLTPLPDAEVDADTLQAVLASIPVTDTVRPDSAIAPEARVLIGADGSFRLGAAYGRAPRTTATLLGAQARERRRLARLAELDAQLAELDTGLGRLDGEDQTLLRDWAAITAEFDTAPDGAEVRTARTQLRSAADRRAEAEDRLAGARTALAAAEQQVREALRSLNRAAARHRLPTDQAGLDELAEALEQLRGITAIWVRRAHDVVRSQTEVAEVRDRLVTSSASCEAAETDLANAQRDQAEAQHRLATLEATVGAPYREILNQLDVLKTEERAKTEEERRLDAHRPELQHTIGQLEERLAQAAHAREAADSARAESHRHFVAAVRAGLSADAGLSVPDDLDGVTAVLGASRAVAATLTPGGQPNLQRLNARVQERLHITIGRLGGRADLDRSFDEDHQWWTLTASTGGVRRRISELAAGLRRELQAGRDELAAEEERLFEQVLAGDIRRSLAARIRSANALVARINDQLKRVSTAAAGVGVRLHWGIDPDQPDAVKAARELLLRDPHDLSEADTQALQDFVRTRVEQARAELEVNAPWDARLRETLDYRSWHRFGLRIAHRDFDDLVPATPTRLQRLSTGERSIVLHLPMIASIAAHYTEPDGSPAPCPRLILLDELFAGVDPSNRAQLFGTFTDWDLDAVFTSDHEWCQYATLDGIAIHLLHPPKGDEPVTSTRFTWDGQVRAIEDARAD